jgi:hypothetical protein
MLSNMKQDIVANLVDESKWSALRPNLNPTPGRETTVLNLHGIVWASVPGYRMWRNEIHVFKNRITSSSLGFVLPELRG